MEAVTRTEEVDEMKTLTKEHQGCSVNQDTPDNYSLGSTSIGWRALSPRIFVSDTFFDLAGMSQREKTMFFEAAAVQEMINPAHTGGVPGDDIVVYDVMTSEPMTDAQLLGFVGAGNFATSSAGLGYQETIYGRIRHYIIDLDTAAWGSFMLASDNQIGSLEATASDRIYSYRIFHITAGTSATQVDVYYARHIIRAEAKEEAEFRYLMRLRRSYELAQNHDED
jgi:hypothetical protein